MNAELRAAHFARLHRQREGRERSVRRVGRLTIPLLERPGEQIGTVVWPGAQLLAEALAADDPGRRWPAQGCAGARIIELGSGVGLCGIAAAMLGAHVVLTERADVLPLLRLNVGAEAVQQQARRAGGTARAQELSWGKDEAQRLLSTLAAPASFDFILGADIVYTQAPLAALHDTVCALCPPDSATTLLLAYRQRDAAVEARFFEALRASGFVLVRSHTASEAEGEGEGEAELLPDPAQAQAPTQPQQGQARKVAQQLLAFQRRAVPFEDGGDGVGAATCSSR